MVGLALGFVSLIRLGRSLWSRSESRVLLIMALMVGAVGTVFYHHVEQMSWLDSLYFCVITLATVGYGDFTPKTDIGKVFTIVYVLVGLGVLGGFFALIGQQAIDLAKERAESRS